MQSFICFIREIKKTINIKNRIYPSEAINAGIATAIRPTAAVAVSNDVLTAY